MDQMHWKHILRPTHPIYLGSGLLQARFAHREGKQRGHSELQRLFTSPPGPGGILISSITSRWICPGENKPLQLSPSGAGKPLHLSTHSPFKRALRRENPAKENRCCQSGRRERRRRERADECINETYLERWRSWNAPRSPL
ncbi:hypothetical protein AOLI_G00238660 [Acnodon oligacanthus]